MTKNTLHNYFREQFVVPFRLWLYRYTRRVLLILIAALVANFAFSYFFYTPKMWRLRAEASTTVAQYELLQKRVAIMSEELLLIKERDRGVYRSIFSQDTLSTPTRYFEPSFNESYGRYAALIQNTESQVEELARKLYHASLSLDDMETLAKNKDAMAERVPAIWPIDRRALRGHIEYTQYHAESASTKESTLPARSELPSWLREQAWCRATKLPADMVCKCLSITVLATKPDTDTSAKYSSQWVRAWCAAK
ncbi:MAG: hypothetical protein RR465_06585 [Mucinivorans sp.]